MSGSYPPPILPKPASGLPFIAPKSNMPGQGVNGSHSDSYNMEENRDDGSSPENFETDADRARRTSQRKRPKVCFTVCLHYLKFVIHDILCNILQFTVNNTVLCWALAF